jgi:hypothetical protein
MPFLRTFICHPLEHEPGSLFRTRPGRPIQAQTLGEAVAVAAALFGVRIVPHDPPKWFRIYGMPESEAEYVLVDIHIFREGEEVCAKQDLSIPLLESDEVSIGMLAC